VVFASEVSSTAFRRNRIRLNLSPQRLRVSARKWPQLLTINIQILHTLSLSPLVTDSIADFFSDQMRWILVIGCLFEPQIGIVPRRPLDDEDVGSLRVADSVAQVHASLRSVLSLLVRIQRLFPGSNRRVDCSYVARDRHFLLIGKDVDFAIEIDSDERQSFFLPQH